MMENSDTTEVPQILTLPLDGPRGLLLPDQGPGRRQEHQRDRRLKVARLVLSGASDLQIAAVLRLSRRTVSRDRRYMAYTFDKAIEAAGLSF